MGNIVIGIVFIIVSLWVMYMGIGVFLDINFEIDILKYFDMCLDKCMVVILPLLIAGIGGLFVTIGILFILGKM